jgi:hypothetical protein
MGVINGDVSAISTANTADATGEFDATGIMGLDMTVGGVTTLKGQVQVKATMGAESVGEDATAFSGTSDLMGLNAITITGASDGSLLGTAAGVFNTSATSTLGNAAATGIQNLTGMTLDTLQLGGNGSINAIVQDTNFVSAHSVSGNATAVASVDAIGLDGGTINISGNATIMANVNVDSKAEAHTVG